MKYKFMALSAFLGLATLCAAQDTLSLAHAIETGLRNNFDIEIQKINGTIAENNNTWGAAGRYPTVNLSAAQNNSVVQRLPANPFAVAGKNISHNVTGQLDVQFVLFNGYAIHMEKERLGELQELTDGNTALVVENTVQNIILAYYSVLLERERINVLKRVMDFSHQQYEYVKLRKELGSAITFDVLNEQNNYLTDSANYLAQEVEFRNAIRQLDLLINEDLNVSFDLIDSLGFKEESYTYADLYERMTRSNTNLKNQYINRELARIATASERSALYPSLTFNVGANGSLDQLNANFRSPTGNQVVNTVGYLNGDTNQPVTNTINETALARQTQHGHSYGAFANFGLRWTLFNGGQIKRTIENAKLNEQAEELGTEQLKTVLKSDLMYAFDLYTLRQQLYEMSKTKVEAAELNLDLANERYKNGSISAIDLRIIQQNYRTAALEIYAAIYSALQSRLELVRLTGGLLSEPSKN